MTNRVTIFSNGLADYRKIVTVKKGEPQQVRIPVNKSDVGDVLASLAIFGDVAYTPPTFSPSNDQDGSLELNPSNVYSQLATQLRGAQATVKTSGDNSITGKVVGLHDEQEAIGETSVSRSSLVLLVDGNFQRVKLHDIKEWNFEDKQVQVEIEKALQRSFQNIKSHSTFVEFTLSTEKDSEEAVVQYITSAAAWKIAYRYRQAGDKSHFEGFAVVDNNTEQDWEDVLVSVVVGEPISFKTDIANVTVPYRSTVQIVSNQAVGAVEAQEAMNFANMAPSSVQMHAKTVRSMSAPMADFAAEGAAGGGPESLLGYGASAAQPNAEAKEIGDYCVFESIEPVTIRSKRSALVPVFKAEIPADKSSVVLYYKPLQHPQRAFRTIKFQNELDHSLGRGVCTIYDKGVMAGTAIMPATKKGQDQLLPHAMDTGVKFMRTDKGQKSESIAVKVSKGVAIIKNATTHTTTYQVKNHKDEAYPVFIDHTTIVRGSDVSRKAELLSLEDTEATPLEEPKKLKDGVRYSFTLNPNQEVLITVKDTVLNEQRTIFGDNLNLGWLMQNIVALGGEFENNEQIKACLEIQKEIDKLDEQSEKLHTEFAQLEKKSDRLRKNMATQAGGEAVDQWTKELVESEKRLTEIDEVERPKLVEEKEALEHKLAGALNDVVANWEKP